MNASARIPERSKAALFFWMMLSAVFLAGYSGETEVGLEGRIVEAQTKAPLGGVTVSVEESSLKTQTDREGRYRLDFPAEGAYRIKFSLPGYEDVIEEEVVISLQNPVRLDIEMVPVNPRLTEDVTVTAAALPPPKNSAGSISTLTAEQVAETPAALRDISRALRVLPGTSSVSDKTNALIVRGGSPMENGYLVDNIPIPNINHFQVMGSGGGAVGLLNLFLVKDLNFYTGGFSVAYGNRMSSFVDISLKEGTREKVETDLYLHLTGFGARMEGPLPGDKGSWILTLNRSYYDLALKFTSYADVVPRLGDIHFKAVYPLGSRNKLTLLNIFGASKLSYSLEKAIDLGLNRYLDFITNQNTVGLNWFSSWGSHGYSNTSLSYSFLNYTYESTAVIPESATSSFKALDEFQGQWNFRNVNVYQFHPEGRMEFGVDVSSERLDYDNYTASAINRWQNLIPDFTQRGRAGATVSGVFLSLHYSLSPEFLLSLGLRGDYFSYNEHVSFSPRLAATWFLNERFTLKGACGLYVQSLPLYLLFGNPGNRENADPYAFHAILGMEYRIDGRTRLTIDVYHKPYRNLPVSPEDPSNFVMDSGVDFGIYRSYAVLNDSGAAFSRGIDIHLQREFEAGFYGALSASIFRSRFRGFDGQWRNRTNDSRYVVTVLAGYEFNEKWMGILRWNMAGGRPYTPFDTDISRQYNQGIIDRNRLYAERYPVYVTLNLLFDRRFKFENSELRIHFGAMNLLNRKNVEYYIWNKIDKREEAIYQPPLLPEFGFEYRF